MRRDNLAKREPNGRRQRPRLTEGDKLEREMISVVMRQPHRMLVPDIYRRSQHAENPVGRLFLLGALSAEDVTAALQFKSICLAYHRAIGAPHRLTSNADLEKVRGKGADPELEDERAARDRWRGIAQRYEEAVDAVKSVAGNYYNNFVRLVVEEVNEDIPDRVLRAALSRIISMNSRRR